MCIMKKIIYLIGFTFLLSACSSSGKYEKTIADFVQTDKKGTKFDLKFKAVEIKELQKITVADSITFLEEKWTAEKEKKVESLKQRILDYEKSIEREKKSRFSMKTFIERYEKNMTEAQQTLNSIQTTTPNWVTIYNDRKKDEVLAILVECKYKAQHPLMNAEFEETRDFVLSPDGSKCYKQSAPKK